jgi:hypothetical protein
MRRLSHWPTTVELHVTLETFSSFHSCQSSLICEKNELKLSKGQCILDTIYINKRKSLSHVVVGFILRMDVVLKPSTKIRMSHIDWRNIREHTILLMESCLLPGRFNIKHVHCRCTRCHSKKYSVIDWLGWDIVHIGYTIYWRSLKTGCKNAKMRTQFGLFELCDQVPGVCLVDNGSRGKDTC